jgi:hypothetical protein
MTYKVVLENMPTRIKAYSRENEDCSYTIVLNARHCTEQQKKSFKHEIEHILHCDHISEDADDIEYKTHK